MRLNLQALILAKDTIYNIKHLKTRNFIENHYNSQIFIHNLMMNMKNTEIIFDILILYFSLYKKSKFYLKLQ